MHARLGASVGRENDQQRNQEAEGSKNAMHDAEGWVAARAAKRDIEMTGRSRCAQPEAIPDMTLGRASSG